MPKENGYERKDHALCYSLKVWKTGIKYAVNINDTILEEMDQGGLVSCQATLDHCEKENKNAEKRLNFFSEIQPICPSL